MKRENRMLWGVFSVSLLAWVVTAAWASLNCCNEWDQCDEYYLQSCIPLIQDGITHNYNGEFYYDCYNVECAGPPPMPMACCRYRVEFSDIFDQPCSWPHLCSTLFDRYEDCVTWVLLEEVYTHACDSVDTTCTADWP